GSGPGAALLVSPPRGSGPPPAGARPRPDKREPQRLLGPRDVPRRADPAACSGRAGDVGEADEQRRPAQRPQPAPGAALARPAKNRGGGGRRGGVGVLTPHKNERRPAAPGFPARSPTVTAPRAVS